MLSGEIVKMQKVPSVYLKFQFEFGDSSSHSCAEGGPGRKQRCGGQRARHMGMNCSNRLFEGDWSPRNREN